jgi:hypothetical protein
VVGYRFLPIPRSSPALGALDERDPKGLSKSDSIPDRSGIESWAVSVHVPTEKGLSHTPKAGLPLPLDDGIIGHKSEIVSQTKGSYHNDHCRNE